MKIQAKNLVIWNGMVSQQVSGGDVYVANLIRAITKRTELILTSRAGELLGETEHEVRFSTDARLAQGTVGITWLYIKRAVTSAAKLVVSRARYKTVIAASPFVCDLLPAAFARADSRTVILFHLLPERKASSLSARIRFFLARLEQNTMLILVKYRFDTVLVGNEALRQKIKTKYPNKRVIVAHAGIDTAVINQTKPVKKDPDLAVFVGRLTSQKGILDILGVVEAATKANKNFRLKIIGDGPDRAQLETEIVKRGITTIEVLGFVDTQTKYETMRRARYFLFPSYEEGWGIALAEALYCRCLSICYELDHYRSLFDDFPVYAKLGDQADLAQKLIVNLDKNVSSNQEKFISRYDTERVIKDVLQQLDLV